MTIEELQEKVLELQSQLTEVTNERDAFKESCEHFEADLNYARELNNKYFLQIIQQSEGEPDEEQEDEDPESVEDFARNLAKII